MTKIKPRTSTVTIFQGDDFEHERELRLKVENAVMSSANDDASRRRVDPDAVLTAATEYDDFIAEATDRGIVVPVQMLGRSKWREMVANHPPRLDNELDEGWGFNFDTLADDLVPASIVEGHFGSIADRDEFLDSLCDADYSKFYAEARNLNQAAGPDPKVRLSSRLAPTFDESSEPPQRLG